MLQGMGTNGAKRARHISRPIRCVLSVRRKAGSHWQRTLTTSRSIKEIWIYSGDEATGRRYALPIIKRNQEGENDMSETEVMIQEAINELPFEEMIRVTECYTAIKLAVDSAGACGLLALALLGEQKSQG